jgi:hypothetical protein
VVGEGIVLDELDAQELDDGPAAVGGGGVIRTGLSEAVHPGAGEAGEAGVMEIFTSLGSMPNFSRVVDTASDKAL